MQLNQFLSYADREWLTRHLESFSTEGVDSTELVKVVYQILLSTQGESGLDELLARNIAFLEKHVPPNSFDNEFEQLALGALSYVASRESECESATGPAEQENAGPISNTSKRLLSEVFVTRYAANEIADRSGTKMLFSQADISQEEKSASEKLFLDLCDTSVSDAELIPQALESIRHLDQIPAGNLLQRLKNNASQLIETLRDEESNQEHKALARGGLLYLIESNDVIDDSLGLVGFLDDAFILQTAVDLIWPNREPLVELLDSMVEKWPFITTLVFDDGGGLSPPSEYSLLNAAVTCSELRNPDNQSVTVVVPEIGCLPFLVGLISALGCVQRVSSQDDWRTRFYEGQKVIVDYAAVAEFAGFDPPDNPKHFKLRSYYKEKGHKLSRTRLWPISDIRRLIPSTAARAIQGGIQLDLSRSELALPAIEYLFADEKHQVSSVESHVVLVAPTTMAKSFFSDVKLYGQPLKDVIPVGVYNPESVRTVPLSSRFGNLQPVLVFVSDLDIAAEYLEEHVDEVDSIIIDGSERNLSKQASINSIVREGCPVYIITDESTANRHETNDMSVWEWSDEDAEMLIWDNHKPQPEAGVISSFENRSRRKIKSEHEKTIIKCGEADEVFAAYQLLKKLKRNRGDDNLVELDEILDYSFMAFNQLLHTIAPPNGKTNVKQQLETICSIRKECLYLSETERDAAARLEEAIFNFDRSLEKGNGKLDELTKLLNKHDVLFILCPDSRVHLGLSEAIISYSARIVESMLPEQFGEAPVVIPAWFGKKRMSRWLHPPVGSPTNILLYQIEKKWYDSFNAEQERARTRRNRLSDRRSIFPTISNWEIRAVEEPAQTQNDDSTLEDLEAIQKSLFERYSSELIETNSANSSAESINTTLVMFSGGSYGFFADSHQLANVTHLLDSIDDDTDEAASIRHVNVRDLVVGDAVLFRINQPDVTREVADSILENGIRDLANLWRQALATFFRSNETGVRQACEQIREAGCRVSAATIERWAEDDSIIAPKAYKRDVAAIAKASGHLELNARIEEVLKAISTVRSAHLRAAHLVGQKVRSEAVDVLRRENVGESSIQLQDGFVIVRVLEVAESSVNVLRSKANRLHEGTSWLE